MTADDAINVLFLCTHNSARSILAEAVMNRLGAGRIKGFSAGSQPSGKVQPYAIELLQSLVYDTSGLRSKDWSEFAAPGAPNLDFIFTVCDNAADETCPVWPGRPISAHWGLPDPSRVTGTEAEQRLAYAETHRMLQQRIANFVNLPLRSLDKESLRARLNEIGTQAEAQAEGSP